MNPVTFNDPLRLASNAVSDEDADWMRNWWRMAPEVESAPLFDWPARSYDEAKELLGSNWITTMKRVLQHGEAALPFPKFRLNIPALKEERTKLGLDTALVSIRAWVEHVTDPKGRHGLKMRIAPIYDDPRVKNQYVFASVLPFTPMPDDKTDIEGSIFRAPQQGSDYLLFEDGQYRHMTDPKAFSQTGGVLKMVVNWVLLFLIDAHSTAHFVAKVAPLKPGRSVEWTQARTHYVLVHKSHPANQKTFKPGGTVVTGADYLKRQGHSRRAHDRQLRSLRYTRKRGQTIRVRATWCGPDEWKQFGSIYRIVK